MTNGEEATASTTNGSGPAGVAQQQPNDGSATAPPGGSGNNSSGSTAAASGGSSGSAATASGGTAAPSAAQPTKPTANEQKPPKITGKYISIIPVVESQRIKLQWTMFKGSKNMLSEHEWKLRKREGLLRHDGKYFDKEDIDDDGKPKEKPFVPTSLRYKNELNCSRFIRTDARVKPFLARVDAELAEGDKIMDEMKARLAKRSKNIALLEMQAHSYVCACIYFDLMYEIAGSVAIVEKRLANLTLTTKLDDLAHAVVDAGIRLLEDDHINALDFPRVAEHKDGVKMGLWSEYQEWRNIDFCTNIQSKISETDQPIITAAAAKLAEYMPVLSTQLWKIDMNRKNELALDAELEEFLGIREIDTANKALGDAMEVDEGEALDSNIEKRVSSKFRKHLASEKRKSRKNYSGDDESQESMPTNHGQRNGRGSNEQQRRGRGRSKKRHSEEYRSDDESSYEDVERQRSRSTPRHHTRPRSILRKNVKWQGNPQRSRSKSSDRRTSGRGRGGRGRGGRGGRGGSRSGRSGRGGRRS